MPFCGSNLMVCADARSSIDWQRKSHKLPEATTYEEKLGQYSELPPSNKRVILKALLVGVLGSIVTTTVMIILFLHLTTSQQRTNSNHLIATPANLTCGDTFETAKRNNCAYDPVANVWLPLHCSRVGLAEFLATSEQGTPWQGQWRYWTNWTGEQEILDISTYRGTYYTTEYEHMAHCAYMLYRLAYTRTHPEAKLDKKSEEWEHAQHCTVMLLKGARYSPTTDVINSYGSVSRSTC